MKNIAVLRGGPSPEYKTSLLSGSRVIDTLETLGYNVLDVFVDEKAKWHHKGLPVLEMDILDNVDAVFNCLHGTYGEDGQVQNILEKANIPFTGPKAFFAAISFHKHLALEYLKENSVEGIKYQQQYYIRAVDLPVLDLNKLAREIVERIAPPFIVKPAKSGSSFGVAYAKNVDELLNLIEKLTVSYDEIVVEEYIFGRELTVAVVENLRSEDLYVSPSIEILKKDKKIFDESLKYSEAIEEHLQMPAALDEKVRESLHSTAKQIFKTLGARDFARIDFILSRNKDLYFLELNSIPGLTYKSLLPQSLEAVGISFEEFVSTITESLENRKH